MSDVHPFFRKTTGARTKSRLGGITIEQLGTVLVRPSSMHGAAVQIKLHAYEWGEDLGIFVNGDPATDEQKDAVDGKLRSYLDPA